ncbi:MAG: hypothetical protein QM496_08680 [Verrucomicrobiota bacterium]
MKNFCTFGKLINMMRSDSVNKSEKAMKYLFCGLVLIVISYGGAGDLFAQDAGVGGEGLFKKLLIRKFDSSLDGSLTGLEKGKAVDFLNRQDRNKDGQISLEERNLAIAELNKMADLDTRVATEKMTPENRNELQRDAKWGEFIKKLPHSNEGRTFTKMPGDAGFSMKGDAFVDPTRIKGVAPGGDRITAAELTERLSKEASSHKLKKQRSGVNPLKKDLKSKGIAKKRDYYDGTTILVAGDEHTVVPEGAVINLPTKLAAMVVKKPKGALLIWPEFIKKYARFVTTREVSWQTAKGEDPISDKEKKAFMIGGKVVVAVFNKNPISVIEAKLEEEDGVVAGSVASDGSRARKGNGK